MKIRWKIAATALALPLLAACGLLAPDAERSDETGEVLEAGSMSAFSLQVGDCFNDGAATEEINEVPILPCAEPHDNEVYHVFDLPDGEFPGQDEVQELGFSGCLAQFEQFIGTPYEESLFEIYPLTPTEGSWAMQDDREVICAVWLDGEMLEGSAAGSAR